MWKAAVLEIKREGYSIKCNRQRDVVLTEKFQQASAVCPYSFFSSIFFFPERGSKYRIGNGCESNLCLGVSMF
jgi:hypothetical protein